MFSSKLTDIVCLIFDTNSLYFEKCKKSKIEEVIQLKVAL